MEQPQDDSILLSDGDSVKLGDSISSQFTALALELRALELGGIVLHREHQHERGPPDLLLISPGRTQLCIHLVEDYRRQVQNRRRNNRVKVTLQRRRSHPLYRRPLEGARLGPGNEDGERLLVEAGKDF